MRTQFGQGDGWSFAQVLPAERVAQALAEEGAHWRTCAYTPLLTLWAFLGQVLSADGSCRAAVARVLAWLLAHGERPCRPDTGPSCKARQRLPESLVRRLTRETGAALLDDAPNAGLWKQRRGLKRWAKGRNVLAATIKARRATAIGDLVVVLMTHYTAQNVSEMRLFYRAVRTPFRQ